MTSTTTDRRIDQPKVGDRVRLVIEGEWKYRDGYRGGGGGFSDDELVSLEVLEPPKPEWQQGDTILARPGQSRSFTLIRLGDGSWACSSDARGAKVPHSHHDQQVNELVKEGAVVLIREGKLVNP